ncbi:hypothetical protein ABK040_003800 [Willaertia magna]
MVKVLVLFYSTYGHIYQMAKEIAAGCKEVEGAEVSIKRVPETLSMDTLSRMGAFQAQQALVDIPIATANELQFYDVIIFGTPTRFGGMAAQMKLFIDSLQYLWQNHAFVGKVASCFVSSGSQHGGQESTILNFLPPLFELGFMYVGLPYTCKELNGIEEMKGGSPYGCSTIVGERCERLPSDQEKKMARFQGRHVTMVGKSLLIGRNALLNNNSNSNTTNKVNTTPSSPVKGGGGVTSDVFNNNLTSSNNNGLRKEGSNSSLTSPTTAKNRIVEDLKMEETGSNLRSSTSSASLDKKSTTSNNNNNNNNRNNSSTKRGCELM